MSYTKIYYDDIWEATSESSKKCDQWLPKLQALSQSFTAFTGSDSFRGQAATNMKDYLTQVHGALMSIIVSVIQSYKVLAIDYYGGYKRLADSSSLDNYDHQLRYTTIVNGEVKPDGPIQNKLNVIISVANQVAIDANNVKNSISDLAMIYSSPRLSNILNQINALKSKVQSEHEKADNYEISRAHDFDEIDRLISYATAIINAQLGTARVPVVKYQSGSIGKMCDIGQVLVDLEATSEKVTAITENENFEEDAQLVLSRDAYIAEEEKESREWVQWVAVGIAVVGAVALTVVTAGGAAPLTCAAVGAVVGGVTAASSKFADNYVETGSFVEGMDWSEFGEGVAVGAIGGFVSGYFGAVSQGSAIKQPIQKAGTVLKHTIIKEASELYVTTGWETAETVYEVGQAIISGKPGDEVVSILKENLDETGKDMADGVKDIVVEGAKSFTGGMISGKFGVDTSEKGVFKKVAEKTIENTAKEAAGGTLGTFWDVGMAVIDNDTETTAVSALKEGTKETISNISGAAVKTVASESLSEIVDGIDNKGLKVAAGTAKDTAADLAGNVTSGVAGRTMDYAYGDAADASRILGDIWEEDLNGGKAILQSAGEAAGDNFADVAFEEKKHYVELKKIDRDEANIYTRDDGKVDIVQFGDYAVTKQDYDAAIENEKKGAYKGQTAQEILGLPRDTDIKSGVQRTVDIDYTVKHKNDDPFTNTVTVDGKYVFTKEYYDATMNAAGTKEYEGRSVREMLDIPEETRLKGNTTTDTVRTDSIGRGKNVELHKQSGTNAMKIDVTETSRQERAKIQKVAKEAAKVMNKNIKNYKFENE